MSSGAQAGRAALQLGAALREQGRFDDARHELAGALEADPDLVEAHVQLGLCDLLQERAEAACEHFQRALKLEPRDVLALLNLGNAHNHLGRYEQALALYRRALAAGPPFATGHNNVGRALQSLGRLEEAAEAYARGLELDPNSSLLLGNLSSVFSALGRPEATRAHCEALVEQHPESLQGWLHLSASLLAEGQADRAARAAQRAVDLDVNSAGAHFQLGSARHQQGLIEDAQICFENALEADPNHAPARNSLAGTLNLLGKLDEALGHWERVQADAPGFGVAFSNLMLCRNYSPAWSGEALRAEAEAWGRGVEARVGEPAEHANVPDPERPLRIGYVSADFMAHPVAMFFEPLLAGRDRSAFHVTCYSSTLREDAVTRRLRSLSDGWLDARNLTDAELAARCRADGVDLLIDLAGHSGGNRLEVFAHQPAPLQGTYIGYPGTTGLSRVQFRLVDVFSDPPGTESHCTEELERLPGCFLAFVPPSNAPPVAKLAPDDPRFFAFGSCNNLAKLGGQVVTYWAWILREAPGARLLIKNASLAHAPARARVEGMFAAHGIASDRLHLMGRVGRREHLSLFNRVGLHLDPFPYSGTATTCEALWMGTPSLTLTGDRHASRVSGSLMTTAGLPDLVCETPEAYVARALELVADLPALRELGQGLRERVASSPLLDGASLARAVEKVYRDRWRRWCSRRIGPVN